MTEEQVRMFCLNNGINASPIGTPLHVLDPTELPASVRQFVNDNGTYKGSGESDNEESGELPTANPSEEVEDSGKSEAESQDLSSLTVVELKDQARDLEISGFSSMTKDELVKAVKKASK